MAIASCFLLENDIITTGLTVGSELVLKDTDFVEAWLRCFAAHVKTRKNMISKKLVAWKINGSKAGYVAIMKLSLLAH